MTTDAFGTLSGIANWTDVASTLGIMAVAVALLMIGGEFDLSAGVMTGTTGLLMGLLTTEWGFSMWLAIVLTFAFAARVGFINGYMVIKTKLPSFIVTLATFFVLQGVNLGVTKAITGTVRVAGLGDVPGYESARGCSAIVLVAAQLPAQRDLVDRGHRDRDVAAGADAARQLDLRASAATRTRRATSVSPSRASRSRCS